MPESDAVHQTEERIRTMIPVAWGMGVRFAEARRGLVRATVPFEGNGNHFGVMYAGVIFTVAEVLGGAICHATFDLPEHFPLVAKIDTQFVAPGTSDLTAVGRMDDDEIERITAAAQPGVKVPFVFETEVLGVDGTVVARTRGDYQLRPVRR